MGNRYEGYFRQKRKCVFSVRDFREYERWSYTLTRFIKSKVEVLPGQRILELGSALGQLYSVLPRGIDYTGLELDPEATRFANDYFGVDCFLNIPLEELDAEDEFDLVFAFEVLEHLNDPLNAIETIRRLLSGGGVFCGTSPFPYSWNVKCDETHMYVLHPANWETLFIRGGFEDVRIYPVSIIPAMWRIHRRLNPIVPFYIPIKYFVSTSLIVAQRQE